MGGSVKRYHLVLDTGQVPVLERDEASRLDGEPTSVGRAPHYPSLESTRAHIQDALILEDVRVLESEGLVVHIKTHDRAVRHSQDGLPGLWESVRALWIDQGPGLIEAVQHRRGIVDRTTFILRPAQAQIAVGEGEDALQLGNVLRVESALDQAVLIDGKVSLCGEQADGARA